MNPMPAAHSRTQSGRGRGSERPGSRTSPVAMAKGEGAAQPRLLKLTLRSNAAPCTQMPEFSEVRKCHPPMCPGEGGEKSTKRSNFQLYQQPASNLTQPQAYLTTPKGQGWVHPGVHLTPTTTSARPQGFCGTSPHGSGLSQTQVLSSLIVTPRLPKANMVPVSTLWKPRGGKKASRPQRRASDGAAPALGTKEPTSS